MESSVESIQYVLEDLFGESISPITLEMLSNAAVPLEYRQTVSLIVDKLMFYVADLQAIAADQATMETIYTSILPLNPPFSLEMLNDSSNPHGIALGRYQLLHFVATQLQAERLLKHNKEGESRAEEAGERGKVVFQLDKMCKDLSAAPPTENPNEKDILMSIISKISEILVDVPNEIISSPPRAIGDEAIALNEAQITMIKRIENAYYDDFLLRRQMLLRRLDVTIQSFLWGESAKGKEGEIVAAIRAQRKHLPEEPYRYIAADALKAPLSLLHEHSKKVTDISGKSLVKTVIIGSVPDRGGRANEMRPKKADMGFGRGGGGNKHHGKGGSGKWNNKGGRNKSKGGNKGGGEGGGGGGGGGGNQGGIQKESR